MTMSHAVLSGLAAIVAYGSVYIIAGASMQQPPDLAAVPWDKFLGVGSGGLAFGVAWYFLSREDRMRAAHERVVSEHLEQHKLATQVITTTFADTVKTILADARADTDRREQRIIKLLKEDS